jgi:hypothetical protein
LVGHTLQARFKKEENRLTSHLLQHVRRLTVESFQSSASAVLLACAGLALMLGVVVASSAPAPAPSFAEPKNYRAGPGPDALAIGDLNGDGRPDLVTANGKAISVLLNGGDGSFPARRDYRAGGNHLAIGDLNGDGKLDLVTTSLGTGNTVSVLLNRGNGRFRAKRDYRTGGIVSVTIGDLNGDRKPDLATANGGGFVSVLLNSGDGRFQASLDYRVQPKLVYLSEGGEGLAIGDLNGDRKVDLAASNMDDDAVSVLINTPGLCAVQDVRRMTLPVATRTLARVNCHVGEVGRAYSEAFKRGLVMWQKPAPGAVRPNGEKVNLLVSLGRKQ